jgi:hypothetical protein
MCIDECECYIHSLKDKENDRNVLGEATIIKKIGDNLYLADYNGLNARPFSILLSTGTT